MLWFSSNHPGWPEGYAVRSKRTPVAEIGKQKLSNGLTLLTQENHATPIVTTMMWYRVGSRVEHPGISGISHFLEHMMFKGTRKFQKGEIDWLTARYGGANNAVTSKDCTAYYFQFAKDRWEVGLDIEADRMVHNRFDPAEVELERQVIVEELKMELDCPWSNLRQRVEAEVFRVHPYGLPVIGWHEDVVGIDVEQMRRHYRCYYTPSNAVLVIAGAFDTDPVVKRVESLFGGLPDRPTAPMAVPSEPPRQAPIRLEVSDHTEVPRLVLAFPAPSVLEPEHFEMQILEKILAGGRLSRLHQRLIDDLGVALWAGTEFSLTLDPYLFFIWLELSVDADPAQVERLVIEELERLSCELIGDEELNRAKSHCRMSLLADFETTLDSASQLGLLESLHHVEYWQDYVARIEQLTPRELRRVARRFLVPDRMAVGVLQAGRPDAG